MTWEPNIVAFCCNWCAYAGADLAGVNRIQYPSNVRVLRVMCSGRVEPSMVLRCLQNGADGVLVLGCHIGDCHYAVGNRKAERRMADTKAIMMRMGVDEDRLLLRWISAAEGALFASTVHDFVELIRSKGKLEADRS
ncbi:MAG TPA: hydrogenase iron-sulfur subunit [Methanomassiliicoccales archaeon]|nr:hydrogenase iron-sulfur subunit [Methanomassiliicoccales archaeon]